MKIVSNYTIPAFLAAVAQLTLCPGVSARWATPEDAQSEVEFEKVEITVERDGSWTEVAEIQRKILKEDARRHVGIGKLYYNPNIGRIKILEAKTILRGQEYPVRKTEIEDKAVASSSSAFDEIRQVLIGYPKVEIGAQIYLKFERKEKATVPGLYSSRAVFGTEPVKKASVRIISSIPLRVRVSDPGHDLSISNEKRNGLHVVHARTIRPVYRVVREEEHGRLDPDARPGFIVSSAKNWSELEKPLVPAWEKVLSEPLPDSFQKILNQAKSKQTDVEKFNTVTSELAATMTYLGDWRTIRGRYIPRPLSKIAESRQGDCKDFSAATIAILRKLGFKAYAAIVNRGNDYQYEKADDLPRLSLFNHAIVRVYTDNRDYWIDPTNFVSFAQGIFPDISGRRSLVYLPEPRLEQIPPNSSENGQTFIARQIRHEGDARFSNEISVRLSGTEALSLTGADLRQSKDSLHHRLLNTVTSTKRVQDWKVTTGDLSSRLVQDISYGVSFTSEGSYQTSAGHALVLPGNFIQSATDLRLENRVSDLFLGQPELLRRETEYVNIEKVGNESLDCEITSPWLEAKRKLTESPRGLLVSDVIALKRALIFNSELKSAEFANVKQDLMRCFENVSVIYRPKGVHRGLASELESYQRDWSAKRNRY
ncbi:MAG: hypothetical protein A2428_15695 [Bdellovibrionales bacterium RIFOXYC1_FULL_54_43]|nr:MAG: hypothetical protein A2428_15695 [Bdellovibrionales bacterium RIFOXYC1_FULL_54_43]